MDPNAALCEIMTMLSEDDPDRDMLIEYLDALSAWIKKAGSLPHVTDDGIVYVKQLGVAGSQYTIAHKG